MTNTPPPTAPPSPPAGAAFAAPYTVAVPGKLPEAPVRPARSRLGVVALVVAIVAVVGSVAAAAVAGSQIGLGADVAGWLRSGDLRALSPVRGWVLVAEIAFWLGTAGGLWAIVQGIAAAIRGRRRTPAFVAIALAVVGPMAYAAALALGVLAFD